MKKIYLDDKELVVSPFAYNVLEAAKENDIVIVAPCSKNGFIGDICCHACIIKVDDKEVFACKTRIIDGMKIEYNSPELKEKRAKRITEYSEKIKNLKKS